MPGHTKCCACHAKSSQQTWRSDAPKCSPSQEISAWTSYNNSDEHVSCIAPATENASLLILFKCPTPAIVFGNAIKPSGFARFWQDPQSLVPATRNDIWTTHSGPNPYVFLTFWLRNLLRATTACTFSASQRPKAVRTWCAFNILTSKFASRHNSVRFFDISTSKSGTFWLRNVLRATTACTCSTSQLPKVVQTRCVLYILASKFASRHTGVQLFISHLASWLRTRRFSEPTFRPQIIGKNTVCRDFRTFSCTCIFLLLTLSLLWSSPFCFSLLYSSAPPLLFSVHIVGSLTSKLPSV